MVLALAACLSIVEARANPREDDIPVAPLPAVEFAGWTNACRLTNGRVTLVAVPQIGRIVFIGPDATNNLLRIEDSLCGKAAPAEDAGNWCNFGGDWLWPVAQSRWATFQGGDWPPSRLLDGRPWRGHAWRCANGDLCCLLTQFFGEPLNIRVERLIRLAPDQDVVTIEQSIERTGESAIPVTLWNISQIGNAERVAIAADNGSKYPGGFRPMMFDPPGSNALTACAGAIVYSPQAGGESKLCSDAADAWIAAERDGLAIVERAVSAETGEYPDGGCALEMYSNAGLGYSEIETLSPEKNLTVGEQLRNTLQIRLLRLPDTVKEDCDLSRAITEALGGQKQ